MRTNEAAGGVILGPAGKIALVQQHNNSWSFPKGGVENGETLLQAALREVEEETGFKDLELVGELGSYARYSIGLDGVGESKDWGSRKRTMFLFRLLHNVPFAPHDPDGEVTDARWVTVDEALALLTHPKDKEFLESVRNKIEDALY